MLKAIKLSADAFIKAFYREGETACFRVFDDRKDGAFSGLKLSREVGKLSSLVPTLKKHNAENRGVFFVVNYGGDSDADITRVNSQFVEMDDDSFEVQWEKVNAFPLPPSVVVKTRKSLHCYWLMESAKLDRFRYVQRQLIAHFGGDPMCVNESRVMRLPGFNHCKEEPVMVECMKFDPDLRYTQEQLSQALPSVAEEPTRAAAAAGKNISGTRKGLPLVGKRCDFMQHCKENAASLPEGLWYAMISNLAVFEGGGKAVHALSKPYPRYNYGETQDKIAHFLESGTKPMTCAKIAECGFQCPKLEAGGCDCKFTLALAYTPL